MLVGESTQPALAYLQSWQLLAGQLAQPGVIHSLSWLLCIPVGAKDWPGMPPPPAPALLLPKGS